MQTFSLSLRRHLPRALPLMTALLFAPAFSSLAADNKAEVAKAVANVQTLLKAPFHQTELEQDKSRLPVQMVQFLNITPGMTVMDMGAGGGYSTEILSAAVGDEGTVYAQNNHHLEQMAGGKIIQQLYTRIETGKLKNVKAEIWEMDAIPLNNQLDLVFWGNNIHDYYHSVGEQGTLAILKNVYDALKPGATFAVVDHIGNAGNDNAKLHRIQPQLINAVLEKAGFVAAETTDIYHNAADTHELSVFDPQIKGHTDRYFIKVKKP
ncbi:class I SAM-dependent methyltransferase [Shewanella avicenniae]|uniref:Class I SAM-dependent methyltransferase n=1 Tax=Shewanella avicenniae TaxID=2814294 RepID=A0ABX7QU32_9GAMM|nr:class I SAM-dependent methyltransferase [Shewanella avicenniae]QSX34537.1 class I SAM-dependent methyltransferase [Shewanella avicenniae]